MNPFEIIVLIFGLVMFGNVMKARYRRHGEVDRDSEPDVAPLGEQSRLRDQVQQLKQRIQVLERIAVEKENSVSREIEQLRDR